jgi:hypothetical protein
MGKYTPTYSNIAEYVEEQGVEPDDHVGEEEDVDAGRVARLLAQAYLKQTVSRDF